jgi:3-oxoadipate enol-lactonase
MEIAAVNGVELEYEVLGSGEPVLLVHHMLADGFLPLVREPALAEHYQLVRYHRRGWVGSTNVPGPVSVAVHAADAVALLDHLGLQTVHVAGHSSGAAVATQLALAHPERIATLTLLELSLLSVPAAEAFSAQAAPAFEAAGSGDLERAIARFLEALTGMPGEQCEALLEARVPGTMAQAVKDASTFFGVELPMLGAWTFGAEQAATLRPPVLSVVGTATKPLWVEIAALLQSAVPGLEQADIEGCGHLLHAERPQPVAEAIAGFLARHRIAA